MEAFGSCQVFLRDSFPQQYNSTPRPPDNVILFNFQSENRSYFTFINLKL